MIVNTGTHYPLLLEKLPRHWRVGYVGDFTKKIEPGFASGEYNQSGSGIPHLRPMNIDRNGKIDLSVVKSVAVTKDLRRLAIGDVLFNNTNSPELVGKTTVITQKAELAFSNHMTRIAFNEDVLPQFGALQLHFLWMRGFFKYNCVKHVNQASVSSGTLSRAVPFVCAPIAEQRAIVAEIEKQFSRLDEAVANLQRVKGNLKRYKASVLNNAVEGRLVEGDYQYEMVKLGSVANVVDPQPSHRTPPTHADGVPYIGIGDVLGNGKVDLQNSRKVAPAVLAEHRARYTVRMGDFIFGKIGTLGKPTLLLPPYNYTLSANVVLVQADGVRLLPEYALIFMESPKLVNMVNRDAKATTQAAYGIKRMRDLDIELPTIEVQRQIISEVDRRLSLLRRVEAEVDTNLKRAQALRQATLAKAFSTSPRGTE